MGSGSLGAGGNVVLLNIWEGRDSGPYLHALHFTYGVGAVLAPLIARPFLSNDSTEDNIDTVWTIKTLYPLIGFYGLISALGFLVYHMIDKREKNIIKNVSFKDQEWSKESSWKTILVVMMSLMIFFYTGVEVAFGTFISTFAVRSGLKMTRSHGK